MDLSRGKSHLASLAVAALIAVGLGVVLIPPPLNAQSQSLTTTTGTVIRSYSQNGFGLDLGQITFAFSSASVTWTDNWVPSATHNFKVPTFGGVSLAPILAQNSTTIRYHFSGTVSSRTLSSDMFLTQMKEPNPYNYKIAVIGTLSGSATTIPIAFTFPSNALQVGTSICVSHLCFSFGDSSAYSPSFNNSTKVLTFTVGNSFNIDPIAVDGSQTCVISSGATSCTETFSPANANDVLIQYQASTGTNLATPTSTVTTFVSVLSQLSGHGSEVWYAINGVSGSITVTCKVGATTNPSGCVIQAVSGADLTHWLDADCPVQVSGTSCTFTTYNAHDLLLGLGVKGFTAPDGDPPAPTAGAGFTLIATSAYFRTASCASGSTNYCGSSGSEYETVSSTGSQTVAMGVQGDWFSMCGLAIAQAASSYQTPTVTVTSTTSTTTSSTTSTTLTLTTYSSTSTTTTTSTTTSTTTPTTTTVTVTSTSYSPTVTSSTTLTSYSPTVTSTSVTTTTTTSITSGGSGLSADQVFAILLVLAVIGGFVIVAVKYSK